jgi:CRISPR-associated endonuclease/helicase Cas3
MLYSHKFDDGTKLELRKHLQDVASVSIGTIQQKQLNFSLPQNVIEDISFIISICHDFGKATKYFQDRLDSDKLRSSHTNHALLSAIAGFIVSMDYLKNKKDDLDNGWKSFIPLMVFYIIAHHHISLGDLSESIGKPENEKQIFKEQINKIDGLDIQNYIFTRNGARISFTEIKEKFNKDIQSIVEDELHAQFYDLQTSDLQQIFLLYFLFSILMEADKSKLILGEISRRDSIEIGINLVDTYKQSKVFEGSKRIKELRERAYKEIVNKVETFDLRHKIYSITLPTGLGKTLTSLSFALRLRDRIKNETQSTIIPKIIYSLPFLSIIDQTERVFNDVFKKVIRKYGNRVLLKDHSLSDVIYKTDVEELDTNKSEFLISSWDAEIILTTIDRLFYSFFSPAREYIMKFHNLFNSIIILDEVQSINDELWLTVKDFFSYLSKIGNSYIVLMTATQPVIFEETDIKEIVSNPESYYKDLNRVTLHPNIEKAISLNEFIDIVIDYVKKNSKDNVMIVLNTIDSSIQLYRAIKERFKNRKVIYLSSNIIPKERLKRIGEIKAKSKSGKVIITTQCIEAGVDIDVDVVFRDFAPLDSINQVAGRCNRHFLKDKGTVFIYRIIDDSSTKKKEYYSYIYGDVHTAKTKEVIASCELSEDKMFSINQNYFKKLKEWHFETKEIIDKMLKCDFSQTRKFHRLLRGDDFLKESIFVELDKESKRVFSQFVDAIQTQDWKEKRNKLFKIRRGLAENTISLYKVGKRKGEKYSLNDFIDERYGLSCLDVKSYDKRVGFLPKNRTIIL